MLELAQTAAESCNAANPDGASAQTSAFSAAVAAALPDIYAVLFCFYFLLAVFTLCVL